MAVKKSVVVLCLGFFCRLRQCMNRLLLKRRNTPTSNCPLLNYLRPAKFCAFCRGGKKRQWRRNPFFDVSSYGRLVVFDRQQKIGAVFEHQIAGGLVLSMEGVQTDFTSVQVELLE